MEEAAGLTAVLPRDGAGAGGGHGEVDPGGLGGHAGAVDSAVAPALALCAA